MRGVNPRRLTILLTAILFADIGMTGNWGRVTAFPTQVRNFQFKIVAEEYAAANGTTVEEINREFLENDQKRYRDEKNRGLPDCTFFSTGETCAIRPIERGGPLIAFPENTVSEIFRATIRAAPSLFPVLIDFLNAALISVAACLVFPVVLRQIWKWLQGGWAA